MSGLHQSQRVVLRLAGLFALDSFGGGFVVQSFAAYWFYLRFGVDPKTVSLWVTSAASDPSAPGQTPPVPRVGVMALLATGTSGQRSTA